MSVRDVVCRLCLKVPHNEFILIDETSRQGLDVLSVKMNFDVNNYPLICDNCVESIKRSLSFILRCLNSEKSILSLDTCENKINIDLRNVYAHNSKEIVDADSYICRFCIKQVEEENCVLLDEMIKENTYLDMFKGYMFKMNLNIIQNPIICLDCRGNIESYFNFLENCYNTEEKINTYLQNEGLGSGEKIMLSKAFQQFPKSILEYSDWPVCEVKKEATSMERVKEFEFTDICNWGEYAKKECSTGLDDFNNSLLHQNGDMLDDVLCTYDTNDSSCLKGNVALCESTDPDSIVSNFAVCMCDDNKKSCSKCNSQFEKISIRPTIYKCKICPYQGARIKSHMLKHCNTSEVTMYKCVACDFMTKHKHSIKRHLLIHKTEAELTMYKCTTCDFKTKLKNRLKSHSLIHKCEAEVTMYKCTACDYKTKHKNCLRHHLLTHKTEAEVNMYKCMACDFKTKQKNNLKRHLLTHKSEAEITTYKCMVCDFKTIHNNSLNRHLLTHKAGTEGMMYKCTLCDYETMRKDDLKRHSLTHQTKEEATEYKCTTCSYGTLSKSALKRHSLRHKTMEEVTVYNCTACDYKTMHRNALTNHSLVHKNDAEVTMYKCEACDFKTRYKNCLKGHSLTHMSKAEVTLYKCTLCDFTTKYEKNLKRHSTTHKAETSNDVQMYSL